MHKNEYVITPFFAKLNKSFVQNMQLLEYISSITNKIYLI